jgi:hypothetical protein
MKNLATCGPREFLKQTSRIRKSAEKWLKATDLVNIRKNMPTLDEAPADADEETKLVVMAENRRKLKEQSKKNLTKMLDAILDEHPDETLELLALACFVEPKDVDNHPVEEYLSAITEMISNEAVIGFFTSLQRLGLMDTSSAFKA